MFLFSCFWALILLWDTDWIWFLSVDCAALRPHFSGFAFPMMYGWCLFVGCWCFSTVSTPTSVASAHCFCRYCISLDPAPALLRPSVVHHNIPNVGWVLILVSPYCIFTGIPFFFRFFSAVLNLNLFQWPAQAKQKTWCLMLSLWSNGIAPFFLHLSLG